MQSFYRPTEKLNGLKGKGKLSGAKRLAYCAVACALLICLQIALGYVYGIEVVTVFFVCFCLVFGVRCGMLTAVAFSLLRCFIWGFYPNVVVLYLAYYPMVAVIFGLLGKLPDEAVARHSAAVFVLINAVLAAIAAACALALCFNLIKVSVLYRPLIRALLWAALAVCLTALAAFDVLLLIFKARKKSVKLCVKIALVTCVAAVCTVAFSLLDDIISPLMTGMSTGAALAYFYSSFIAMLPQVVCTIVTVSLLYLPLTAVLGRVALR